MHPVPVHSKIGSREMSTPRYMLDTNIVSYYVRRTSPQLETKVDAALRQHSIAISCITRAELRHGQAAMAVDDRRRSLIDGFLLRLPTLDWTAQAADCYGILKDTLKR
jgi:tRNA(fMet)-specific endonuclease VapC